jgi:ribonuclease G
LHPFLHAYYAKGIFSKRFKWWWKYRKWVNLVRDSSLGITEFHFLNRDGEEIEIRTTVKEKEKEKEKEEVKEEVEV